MRPGSFTCALGSLSAQLRLCVPAADGSRGSGWRFGESRLNLLLCEAERRNFNLKPPKCPKQVDQRYSCSLASKPELFLSTQNQFGHLNTPFHTCILCSSLIPKWVKFMFLRILHRKPLHNKAKHVFFLIVLLKF